MSQTAIHLDNPFVRGLACASLNSNLRSILILDPQPDALRSSAVLLSQMLEHVTGRRVMQIDLGLVETDDELWGSLALRGSSDELPLTWQPGLLTEGIQDQALRLVLIPNLTQLSIVGARACTMLMSADVAQIDRHGQNFQWQPDFCWLASCSTEEIRRVSPHLLDRFALRLHKGFSGGPKDKVEDVLKWVYEKSSATNSNDVLPDDLRAQLRSASRCWPSVTEEAVVRLNDYFPGEPLSGSRREVALARLAHSNARLNCLAKVGAQDVEQAAQMIGLKRIISPLKESRQSHDEQLEKFERKGAQDVMMSSPPDAPGAPAPSTFPRFGSMILEEQVYEPDATQTYPASELTLADPYPEDEAPIERESASLRLPLQHYRAATASSGPVIGVERATTLHDLALVSSILEAAKFQPIRRRYLQDTGTRFLFSSSDLRSYRRAPVPDQMLVLLLDYTCLRDRNWQEALVPYLRWAYVEHAGCCLIQVGSSRAVQELRAESIIAPSILTPRFSTALTAGAGRATPLAHGLDLALQALRHALQHGRSAVRHARLVLITDGRGNVPLESSRSGRITGPVRRKGIEDALAVAQSIRGMDYVEAVLLNPQPQTHAELPSVLAETIGAELRDIPALETLKV